MSAATSPSTTPISESPVIWLDTIAQGLLLGGLYALFAAGLGLVFGIMRLVNLACGDLIVLTMFGVPMLLQTHLFNGCRATTSCRLCW